MKEYIRRIVWFIGALKSDMDESITENKLKRNGLLICTAKNTKSIKNASTDASRGKCGEIIDKAYIDKL